MIALDTLLVPRLRLLPELPGSAALATGWSDLDAALPDHGFPKGVIELAAPRGLGGATRIALAAVRAAHEKDAKAWCAWVDAEGTLYGPGVAKAGVDLDRLLVVRPPVGEASRIAAKVAGAKAFEVIVVDLPASSSAATRGKRDRGRTLRPEVLVRKLALLAEQGGASIFLLTDSLAPRDLPWPVALRLELARAPGHIVMKVAKDRQGRVGQDKACLKLQVS